MPLVYGIAGLIYAITAGAFIALFVYQSQSYTLETSITTYDKTGQQEQGYGANSCSMASLVSKSVTLHTGGSDTKFTSEVYLSAIHELYPQCVADMDSCNNLRIEDIDNLIQ
jgi:hypothetical protein